MLARRIVSDDRPVDEILYRTADEVAFGRMQVAARGIHPQSPGHVARALPSRDSQAVEKQLRHAGPIQGCRCHMPRGEGWSVGWKRAWLRMFQVDQSGAPVAAKWVRLRGPIQIARPPRKAIQAVLRLLVVVDDLIPFVAHPSPFDLLIPQPARIVKAGGASPAQVGGPIPRAGTVGRLPSVTFDRSGFDRLPLPCYTDNGNFKYQNCQPGRTLSQSARLTTIPNQRKGE